MRTLLDAAHWLLTLLLGAGYFDTRRKIKAERRLRQENSDISSIDQAIKGLEDLRGIYARRRSKRAWRRAATDDEVMKAEMALENTVLRVTYSEDLRRAIEDYKDAVTWGGSGIWEYWSFVGVVTSVLAIASVGARERWRALALASLVLGCLLAWRGPWGSLLEPIASQVPLPV